MAALERPVRAAWWLQSLERQRWGAWLEKYVKNPHKAEPKKMTNDQALVVR